MPMCSEDTPAAHTLPTGERLVGSRLCITRHRFPDLLCNVIIRDNRPDNGKSGSFTPGSGF